MVKKLIIILFMFPVLAYGQIRLAENYSLKQDKVYHIAAGSVLSTSSFLVIYKKTNDIDLAFRGACMIPVFFAMGKETMDLLKGGEISLSDMVYSTTSAILTAFILKTIVKRKKKKLTQQQIFELEY